jgi:hypothetical protein
MKQASLSEVGFERRKRPARRAVFLDQMAAAVPWGRLEALILPHDPVAGRGRHPYARTRYRGLQERSATLRPAGPRQYLHGTQQFEPIHSIAAPFNIGLPSFLKHLRILEDDGLISSEKVVARLQ